ncbi:MAG: hypothetical protein ACI9IA_000987 [Enterobacterales bacterium]|jgi:hypothetical protein
MVDDNPSKIEKLDTKYLLIMVLVLIIIAVAASTVRFYLYSTDNWPEGDSAWTMILYTEVHANDKGAVVQLPQPWDTPYVKLYAQSLSHPDLKQQRNKKNNLSNDIVLVASKVGELHFTAQFDFHQRAIRMQTNKPLTEKNLSTWLVVNEDLLVA